MIPIWLHEAASQYNRQSLANRDAYAAVLLMPIQNLATILDWTFQSLPDEILVGMDSDHERANPCLLYTSPSPRDVEESRMPSSA